MPSVPLDRYARRIWHPPESKLMAGVDGKSDGEVDGGSGWIKGYAVTWNNIDRVGDRFRRGAFLRSINAKIPAGKVKLMVAHFRDGGDSIECIGTVSEAVEDDFGLLVKALLSSVQLAQDTRTKVLEGHITTLSAGYLPIQVEYSPKPLEVVGKFEQIRDHLESELFEVTVTARPVNEWAVITEAKSQSAESHRDTDKGASELPEKSSGSTVPTPLIAPAMKARLELDRDRARTLGLKF